MMSHDIYQARDQYLPVFSTYMLHVEILTLSQSDKLKAQLLAQYLLIK